MPLLSILTYPARSLKEPSVPVEKVTPEIKQLVKDMFETMKAGNGIGLAAAQVGKNINLFVMDVGRKDPNDKEKIISQPFCFINPKIIEKSGTITFEEGCLSCPELTVEVKRAQRVIVEALNPEGKPVTEVLEDLEAICVQHEMDHLQGILLVDQLSRLKREMYEKQIKKTHQESKSDSKKQKM
jgi:peptide deformylase